MAGRVPEFETLLIESHKKHASLSPSYPPLATEANVSGDFCNLRNEESGNHIL